MNEIIKAMQTRRSIRSFKPDMPDKGDIAQIIEAGLYAPNGRGKQGAIIVAVTNKAMRDRLAAVNNEIKGGGDHDPFYGAPVVLIVLADKSVSTSIYDGSLVMGNMLLAAHSLGLGGIWIHRARQEFEMPEFKQLLSDLGVEGEWEGVGHCAVGYPAGDLPAPPPRNPNRVYYVE